MLSPHLRPYAVHNLPRCVSVCVRPECPVPPPQVPSLAWPTIPFHRAPQGPQRWPTWCWIPTLLRANSWSLRGVGKQHMKTGKHRTPCLAQSRPQPPNSVMMAERCALSRRQGLSSIPPTPTQPPPTALDTTAWPQSAIGGPTGVHRVPQPPVGAPHALERESPPWGAMSSSTGLRAVSAPDARVCPGKRHFTGHLPESGRPSESLCQALEGKTRKGLRRCRRTLNGTGRGVVSPRRPTRRTCHRTGTCTPASMCSPLEKILVLRHASTGTCGYLAVRFLGKTASQ